MGNILPINAKLGAKTAPGITVAECDYAVKD